MIDVNTREWRIRNNEKIKEMYHKIAKTKHGGRNMVVRKRRLLWAGHAWQKVGSLIH